MFAMTLMLIDPPSPLDDPTLCPATRCSSRRCSRPPSKPLLGSCAIRCESTFALPFSTHALDIAMTATISRKAVALAMADGLCHQTSGDGLAVAVPARLLTTEHEGPCPMAATRLSAQRLKRKVLHVCADANFLGDEIAALANEAQHAGHPLVGGRDRALGPCADP